MEPITPTSQDLPQAVHAALRSWHSGNPVEPRWRDMLIVRQRLTTQVTADLELAVKDVLLTAIDTFEQQASREATAIIRLRFLDGLTARATANRLNLTENVVYKQQHTALAELAALIELAEREARSAKAAGVLERLEVRDSPRLFGVQDKLADLLSALATQGPPWLVAVVGIGGIGKTALADAAARACAPDPAWADVAWVSARQDRFTYWGGLETQAQAPALTCEALVDAIVEQLGFRDLAQLDPARKQRGLRARLKALSYLVVVDNLETAADYHALVPDLHSLAEPTRFLLTSRHGLHDVPGVRNVSLDELSAADSLAMLRHEAGERGLADVAAAADASLLSLYEVAGGNPLALKLLLGQMHALSLSQVVDNLRQARGRSAEELYHFIYWRSWHLLSEDARRVLAVMPLVAESGGGLEQIGELSTLPEESLGYALRQLVTFSLVNARGPVEARRYSLHRLTETFLLREVLKWQAAS